MKLEHLKPIYLSSNLINDSSIMSEIVLSFNMSFSLVKKTILYYTFVKDTVSTLMKVYSLSVKET